MGLHQLSSIIPPITPSDRSAVPQFGAFNSPTEFGNAILDYQSELSKGERKTATRKLVSHYTSFEAVNEGFLAFNEKIKSLFLTMAWCERSRLANARLGNITETQFWRDVIPKIVEVLDAPFNQEKYSRAMLLVGAEAELEFLHPLLRLGDIYGIYGDWPPFEVVGRSKLRYLTLKEMQRLRIASRRLNEGAQRVEKVTADLETQGEKTEATKRQADCETHCLFMGGYDFEFCWHRWPAPVHRGRGCPWEAFAERKVWCDLQPLVGDHAAGKAAEALVDIFHGRSVREDDWRDSKLRHWIDARKENNS